MNFKSGFVAVVGKPNVGKSSLVNAILKEKVSIVSPKPQTTRNKINGILNLSDAQIIFTDTPGVFSPNNQLDKFMQKSVKSASAGVDIIVAVLDGTKSITEDSVQFIKSLKNQCDNVIVVVNKTDATSYEKLYPQLNKLNDLSFVKHIIPTSATKNNNIELLIEKIKELLPEGQPFYEQDTYTDKSLKFMVAEIIREKSLWILQEEIPHGLAIEIVRFIENENLVTIDADIICEKSSHKKIVIGKTGEIIKKIGTNARKDIEKLLDNKVFLNLFVKVKGEWRNKQIYLNDFGYNFKDLL